MKKDMGLNVRRCLVIKPTIEVKQPTRVPGSSLTSKCSSIPLTSSSSIVHDYNNLLLQLKPKSKDYIFVWDRMIQFLSAKEEMRPSYIVEQVGTTASVVKKVLKWFADADGQEARDHAEFVRIHKKVNF